MKPLNILIFILLTDLNSYGQNVQSDTFLSRVKSTAIRTNDKAFLQASEGAENYINSILGDTFYASHIKINFKQTEKDKFDVYVGKSGDAKFLESHIYYNIHYYVIDKKDTLSYFNLLVDSIGRPTQLDKDYSFSSPTKLVLSFKNLFPNKFKIDFTKATTIVKQRGFHKKPFLNYQTDNNKEGLYWQVSNKLADGRRRVFNINVDTGETSEFYFTAFEE